MVKYFIPIFLSIIWIGGIIDIIHTEAESSLIFMLITGIVLILATIIFTRLPPKNPEWEEDEKRC